MGGAMGAIGFGLAGAVATGAGFAVTFFFAAALRNFLGAAFALVFAFAFPFAFIGRAFFFAALFLADARLAFAIGGFFDLRFFDLLFFAMVNLLLGDRSNSLRE